MTKLPREFRLICAVFAAVLVPLVAIAQEKAAPTPAPVTAPVVKPAPAASTTPAPSAGVTTTAPAAAAAPGTAAAAPGTAAAASGTAAAAPGTAAVAPAPAGTSGIPVVEPPATEAPVAPTVDGATHRVQLRDLEQRVDELKEQIRRSHTRLALLSDTILSGGSGGARVEIEFVNDLSGAWNLVEAVIVLDGAVQYKKSDDTGVLAKQKSIPIFSGSIPTGDHTVQVMLKLRGHGFGVFSYLRGMEASVTSSHSFTITDGKVLQLRATAWEQGGPTTPVEEQPDIRFQQTMRSASDNSKPAVSAGTGASVTAPSSKSSTTSSAVAPAAKADSTTTVGAPPGGLSVGGEAQGK